MKKMIVAGFVILSTIVLSACTPGKTVSDKIGEQIAEKAFEAQTGAKVDIDTKGEDITIKTEDGQTQYSAGGQAKLPDNFPKELVVVGDAKIIMSTSSGQSSSVSYVTNEEKQIILEKYISELTGRGWKKDTEVNVSEAVMVNFSKDKMNVAVNIGENNTKEQAGKSSVNVIYTVEEE